MPEPIFMKLGTYIMAPEPIPNNLSRQYVYPLIIAGQRLGKNPAIVARKWLRRNPPSAARQRLGRDVTAVTNTHATIEELLDASFSMCPVAYQGK
jgi:hypothetical protein